MERIFRTDHFGSHRVDLVEQLDEDGASYVVLVDGVMVTDFPLDLPPSLEEVERIYRRDEPRA